MSGGIARRKGKKNRKHGRWSRAPSMRRYVAENRYESNKRRRVDKHLRRMAKKRLEAKFEAASVPAGS